ncbi:hypothetical protein METHPM2_190002 [Pseudomonas sp. PM2]
MELPFRRDLKSQKADERAEISTSGCEKNQIATTFLDYLYFLDVKILFPRPWIQCNDP